MEPSSSLTQIELERMAREMTKAKESILGADFGQARSWMGLPIGSGGLTANRPPIEKYTPGKMQSMIYSRMGWEGANAMPFAQMQAYKLDADQAVVFVILNGKALLIHDDLNLFPSDALVTQLRVLTS